MNNKYTTPLHPDDIFRFINTENGYEVTYTNNEFVQVFVPNKPSAILTSWSGMGLHELFDFSRLHLEDEGFYKWCAHNLWVLDAEYELTTEEQRKVKELATWEEL